MYADVVFKFINIDIANGLILNITVLPICVGINCFDISINFFAFVKTSEPQTAYQVSIRCRLVYRKFRQTSSIYREGVV